MGEQISDLEDVTYFYIYIRLCSPSPNIAGQQQTLNKSQVTSHLTNWRVCVCVCVREHHLTDVSPFCSVSRCPSSITKQPFVLHGACQHPSLPPSLSLPPSFPLSPPSKSQSAFKSYKVNSTKQKTIPALGFKVTNEHREESPSKIQREKKKERRRKRRRKHSLASRRSCRSRFAINFVCD